MGRGDFGVKVGVEEYRFGFNGKEKDESFGGSGSSTVYDYGFRIYNPQIAKFLSVDPLTKSYPMLTPYQFASNNPIESIDLDGLESFSSKNNVSSGESYFGPLNSSFIESNNLIRTDLTPNSNSAPQPNVRQGTSATQTATTSVASGMGLPGLKASAVRLNYALRSYALKSIYDYGTMAEKLEASKLRNSYVLKARNLTPEPYLSMAEDLKGSNTLKPNPNGRFYKTNSAVNLKMTGLGVASGIGVGYGLYSSYQRISNSENKIEATAIESGTWAGSLYGASQGAAFGTSVGGPWGGVFLGVTGGFVGGFLGEGAVNSFIGSGGIGVPAQRRDPSIVEQDNTRISLPRRSTPGNN